MVLSSEKEFTTYFSDGDKTSRRLDADEDWLNLYSHRAYLPLRVSIVYYVVE
jgi:hypothetical protein